MNIPVATTSSVTTIPNGVQDDNGTPSAGNSRLAATGAATENFATYDAKRAPRTDPHASSPTPTQISDGHPSPQADRHPSFCTRSRADTRKAALKAMPDYIDGAMVLKQIVAKWTREGVKQEKIDALQNGIAHNPKAEEAAAIQDVGKELMQSGLFDTLRQLSIDLHRNTCTWQKMRDLVSAKRPQYTTQELDDAMIRKLFTWHDTDYRANAQLLNRLLKLEKVIDMDYQDKTQQALDEEVRAARRGRD